MNVALTFTFAPVNAAKKQFDDVDHDFWAKDEIDYLSSQSIINGYKDGSFKPNNNVTRAQAAIMIAGALDLALEGRPNPKFTDIRQDFYAYDIVAAVADEGIISGRDGRFMPNDFLTRGQMAAVLQRAFELEGKWNKDFSDIEPTHTFYNEIQALAGNSITTGYTEDNTFRAYNPTTRAQFSVFLARALDDTFKPGTGSLSNAEASVIELTNIARRKQGLPDLQVDLALSNVAREKSRDMSKNSYFSHISPTYGTPSNMVKQFGISTYSVAENIARGYTSPESVVQGWINSEGHRRNIMGNYTHIGIGYDQNGHYWTQLFMNK